MNKVELFDLMIDDGSLEETVTEIIQRIQRNEVIEHVGVNSNKVVLSHRNTEIKKIIQQADMVSADGYSVVRACRWIKKKKIDRVTGIDTMMALLEQAEKKGMTVYFLGTKEAILNRLLEVPSWYQSRSPDQSFSF